MVFSLGVQGSLVDWPVARGFCAGQFGGQTTAMGVLVPPGYPPFVSAPCLVLSGSSRVVPPGSSWVVSFLSLLVGCFPSSFLVLFLSSLLLLSFLSSMSDLFSYFDPVSA